MNDLFEDALKQTKDKLVNVLVNELEYPNILVDTSLTFYQYEITNLLKNNLNAKDKDPIATTVNEAVALIKADEDGYFEEFYASSIESL